MCFDILEFGHDGREQGYCVIGVPGDELLADYYREFKACEVNSVLYAIPQPISLKAMAGKSFIFTDYDWRRQAIGTMSQLRVMLD